MDPNKRTNDCSESKESTDPWVPRLTTAKLCDKSARDHHLQRKEQGDYGSFVVEVANHDQHGGEDKPRNQAEDHRAHHDVVVPIAVQLLAQRSCFNPMAAH
eukprot:CAMPEP_0115178860 /NCGR_PEP_ID=MMETSP0270-20121206/6116_1 /TAXON_ID=71861 /ORGANISM="Scrippsiella trochoidea, Strain CCMP3099" /LENGTH=100 /DNA_ID=CAMNT_0002591831 /DNA_START=871 /DNA_END=1173 /DNA_ORIENTATION=-